MNHFRNLLCAVALLPPICIAQVQVLGFELGTSTQQHVKAKLGKKTEISNPATNKFSGGLQFTTSGAGYDIEGLSSVVYIFDKEQRLSAVLMEISKGRFDEIFNVLAGKYKLTRQQRPFVGNKFGGFKAEGVTIELDAPHLSFEMHVSYIRDDLYNRFRSQSAQEALQQKDSERGKF